MKRFKWFVFLIVPLLLASFACTTLLGGGSPDGDTSPDGWNGQGQEQSEDTWYDEDGYPVVGDESTAPRFPDWLEVFIASEYPGAVITDYGSWKQAVLPNGLVISWAEWGEEQLTLGQVDGLYEGKSLFVAMRDHSSWVDNPLVNHRKCVGTYIPAYNNGMASFDVHQSTIIQFDGNGSRDFVDSMVLHWSMIRAEFGGCP